jgi:high-affinity Fe2+/Pb2+ permease
MNNKSFSYKEKIFEGIIVAVVFFVLQTSISYFLQPSTVTRTKQAETLYAEKQKTYFEAINIINRMPLPWRVSPPDIPE